MNIEKYLENCVDEKTLEERGYHKKKHVMWKRLHEQEIRFVEVAHRMYVFDGIYYSGKNLTDEEPKDL